MSETHESTAEIDQPSHHVTSISVYVGVFAFLLLMTWTTVEVSFIDLGPLNTPAAIAIAVAKATAVVLYFMHVRQSTKMTKAVVLGAIFWLGVLFVLTLTDYVTRGWLTR